MFFEHGAGARRLEQRLLGLLRQRGVPSLCELWGEVGRFDGYRETFLACDVPVDSLPALLSWAGMRRPAGAVWCPAPAVTRRRAPSGTRELAA